MRYPVYLLGFSLLAGCAANGYQYHNEPTPFPQLTTATLHHPLTIRADRAREYIQSGDKRLYQDITLWNVHCSLVLRTVSERERTVQPDTFTITGIHRDRFMAGRHGAMMASGNDYNPVMSTTTFTLHSDRQPDVFRLECEVMDEPHRARHVRIDEMRQALGDLITLK